MSLQRRLAFAFGVCFVVGLIALAVAFPEPTPFQYNVFRSVLALALAGVAATIPGFFELTLPNWVRAGGALAVFVFTFFYNPASLVTETTPDPERPMHLGELTSTVLNATTAEEADRAVTRLQEIGANGDSVEKEQVAKALARLVVRCCEDAWGKEQGRIVRSRVLDLFREFSSYEFYTYFEKQELEGRDLAGLDFSGARINSLSFDRSFLINSDFGDADLFNVSFRKTSLRNVSFEGAKLENCDFTGSDWYNSIGIELATLDSLGPDRIGTCPASIEEFVRDHDGRYGLVKFAALTSSVSERLQAGWQKLLDAGICAAAPPGE